MFFCFLIIEPVHFGEYDFRDISLTSIFGTGGHHSVSIILHMPWWSLSSHIMIKDWSGIVIGLPFHQKIWIWRHAARWPYSWRSSIILDESSLWMLNPVEQVVPWKSTILNAELLMKTSKTKAEESTLIRDPKWPKHDWTSKIARRSSLVGFEMF